MHIDASQTHNSLLDKKIGSGLVFGKFMPLHEGHVHLLNFARLASQRLTILVCTLSSEPIPGEVRFQWVKKQFPDANVVHHYADIPQDPSEHPDFWNIWKESIKRHCPNEDFDALFGSEDYGWKMAEVMGIGYIPVDRVRNLVPISGTEMRKEPMKNWEYLPPIVRPYFAKRVAIVGPDFVGKPMLTKKLAEYYSTVSVAQYAQGLLDGYVSYRGYKPGEIRYEDISTIARGQMVTEDSLVHRANRVIISDTELTSTVYWSNFYFKKCPQWLADEAKRRKHDLYIIPLPDLPETENPQHPMADPVEREKFVKWWEETLNQKGARYVKISGDKNAQLGKAIKEIDDLIEAYKYKPVKFAVLATDIVTFAFDEGKLKVLLVNVDRPPHFNNIPGFPGGLVDPTETVEDSALRHLYKKGVVASDDIYIEQLRTFSAVDRDPRGRVVSTAFLGLVKKIDLMKEGEAYWEDVDKISELAYDHKRILEVALDRLRSKIEHSDLVTHLMPKGYSLDDLKNAYEAISGNKMDYNSFQEKAKNLNILSK